MFNKLFNIVQKLYLSTSSFLKNTFISKRRTIIECISTYTSEQNSIRMKLLLMTI